MNRILFLDLDGTLNLSLDNRSPNSPAKVELLPNVAVKLAAWAGNGW